MAICRCIFVDDVPRQGAYFRGNSNPSGEDPLLLKHEQTLPIPFPKQALVFTCLQCRSFENTVGKFLLFPQCFLPFWRTLQHFHQT